MEGPAIDRLKAEVLKPSPDGTMTGSGDSLPEHILGDEGVFAPWDAIGVFYGSYCSDFDDCAIDVLKEILAGKPRRYDLGARMFREVLCCLGLCDYGTSPRVCFPTPEFKQILPELIEKWGAYVEVQWND